MLEDVKIENLDADAIVSDFILTMKEKHNFVLHSMGDFKLRLVVHLHIQREHLVFLKECFVTSA